jgi:hypothetical protein
MNIIYDFLQHNTDVSWNDRHGSTRGKDDPHQKNLFFSCGKNLISSRHRDNKFLSWPSREEIFRRPTNAPDTAFPFFATIQRNNYQDHSIFVFFQITKHQRNLSCKLYALVFYGELKKSRTVFWSSVYPSFFMLEDHRRYNLYGEFRPRPTNNSFLWCLIDQEQLLQEFLDSSKMDIIILLFYNILQHCVLKLYVLHKNKLWSTCDEQHANFRIEEKLKLFLFAWSEIIMRDDMIMNICFNRIPDMWKSNFIQHHGHSFQWPHTKISIFRSPNPRQIRHPCLKSSDPSSLAWIRRPSQL